MYHDYENDSDDSSEISNASISSERYYSEYLTHMQNVFEDVTYRLQNNGYVKLENPKAFPSFVQWVEDNFLQSRISNV